MSGSTSYEIISTYAAHPIREAMLRVSIEKRSALTEVRLRSGRPVSFVCVGGIKFLTKHGELTSIPENSDCIRVSAEDIAYTVNALCRYSVHSCRKELTEGYFVIENGIRVGASGTMSDTADGVLKDFNGLNFRLSREVMGCADELYNTVCNDGTGVIICGGVNSGKTTMLRDLCRIIGKRYKVALIDERNEISAVRFGQPQMDIGVMTDVIVGMNRSKGITSALRTLSPDMIFCDEISTEEDAAAILAAHGCGVEFAATIHCTSYDDLMKRRIAADLFEAEVFGSAVFLGKYGHSFGIREIRRLKK